MINWMRGAGRGASGSGALADDTSTHLAVETAGFEAASTSMLITSHLDLLSLRHL